MADEEQPPAYTYVGARAPGETISITAGETPKQLTRDVALLGAREGYGEAYYPNGDVYKGEWADGKRDGSGTYAYAAPLPEEGEEPKPPTTIYEGKWKAGARSGLGMLTYASGSKYHGNFARGKFSGQGTFFYANGDTYCGEWVRGKKHGTGVYIHKATNAKTHGKWILNKCVSGGFGDSFANTYSGTFNSMGPLRAGYGSGDFALASGATCPAPPASRLVLMASDTPDKADFVRILGRGVIVVEYDAERATGPDLVGLIRSASASGGGPFESIGLAHHGVDPGSGVVWQPSKELCVTSAASIGADVRDFLHALGVAIVPGGRCDLFACSLLKTAEGRAVFAQIQARARPHGRVPDRGCMPIATPQR